MRFVPDRAGFLDLARRGRLAFVYREVLADTDTPVSAYAKLGRGPYSFLLESVVGRRQVGRLQLRRRAPARGGAGARLVRRGAAAATTTRLPGRGAGDREEPMRFVDEYLAKLTPAVPPGLPRFFGGAVGLAGLRHRPQLRAAARARSPTTSACPSSASRSPIRSWCSTTCAARSRSSRRSTSATAADPGRAYDDACARIEAVLDRLARPAPPLRPLDPALAAAAARAERDRHARGVRGRRPPHPGVHPRRRRLPGGLLAALRGAARRRRPVRRLPRAAGDQPVAVHVPSRVPRGGGHRRLARGAGAAGRRRGRGAAHRRHAPARRQRRGGRRARGRAARTIRRSWPST